MKKLRQEIVQKCLLGRSLCRDSRLADDPEILAMVVEAYNLPDADARHTIDVIQDTLNVLVDSGLLEKGSFDFQAVLGLEVLCEGWQGWQGVLGESGFGKGDSYYS